MKKTTEHRNATARFSPLSRASIETADGGFTAEFSSLGLARLGFPGGSGNLPLTAAERRSPIRREGDQNSLLAGSETGAPEAASSGVRTDAHVVATPPPSAWLKQTRAAIEAVLAGRAPRVFPPLDLSCGTPFQRLVWQALREIPVGETRTYGEIARDIGRPRAVRAVGAACGANPVPLLVPCHRVLAANGKLGGFSGGPEWKPRLLRREGSWGASRNQKPIFNHGSTRMGEAKVQRPFSAGE